MKKLIGAAANLIQSVVTVDLVGSNDVFLQLLAACICKVLESERGYVKASAKGSVAYGNDIVVYLNLTAVGFTKLGVVERSFSYGRERV